MRTTRWILGLAGALLLTGQASATLLGDTVQIEWLYPDSGTIFASDTVTVGAGVEVTCPGSFNVCSGFVADTSTIDFDAFTITTQLINGSSWNPASFNGFLYSGIDNIITGFSLDTNITGLDVSRVSFSDHSIGINLQGLGADVVNDRFMLTLEFLKVPEPTSLALTALGLVGLGFSRRKKAA